MTSLKLAENIAKCLSDKKAENICIIDLQNETSIADYFVVCETTSSTSVKALSDYIEFEMEKLGEVAVRKDGLSDSLWIVVDFSNVIVHIFHKELREFYNLEKLWNKGKNIKQFIEKAPAAIAKQKATGTKVKDKVDTTKTLPKEQKVKNTKALPKDEKHKNTKALPKDEKDKKNKALSTE